MAKTLDVICIGRSSVDLYGEQVGGRLEDMASFAKYVGGCPTNISIGTARLGLKPGLITAVGDEHMGRFIKEQVSAEGVDIRGVKTDPARLTSLVDPRHPRRAHVSPDLLPRQLRGCGADRRRRRRGLHRLGGRGRGLGHPLLQAQPRCHEQEGDAARQEARRPGDLRHRLPAGAVGPDRPWPRRGALRRQPGRLGPPADHPAGLRRDRRHRGRDPHRGRHHRHARRMPQDPGARARSADRGQARPDGLRGVRPRHPRATSSRASRARASRSRCSTSWARATPS